MSFSSHERAHIDVLGTTLTTRLERGSFFSGYIPTPPFFHSIFYRRSHYFASRMSLSEILVVTVFKNFRIALPPQHSRKRTRREGPGTRPWPRRTSPIRRSPPKTARRTPCCRRAAETSCTSSHRRLCSTGQLVEVVPKPINEKYTAYVCPNAVPNKLHDNANRK